MLLIDVSGNPLDCNPHMARSLPCFPDKQFASNHRIEMPHYIRYGTKMRQSWQNPNNR